MEKRTVWSDFPFIVSQALEELKQVEPLCLREFLCQLKGAEHAEGQQLTTPLVFAVKKQYGCNVYLLMNAHLMKAGFRS